MSNEEQEKQQSIGKFLEKLEQTTSYGIFKSWQESLGKNSSNNFDDLLGKLLIKDDLETLVDLSGKVTYLLNTKETTPIERSFLEFILKEIEGPTQENISLLENHPEVSTNVKNILEEDDVEKDNRNEKTKKRLTTNLSQKFTYPVSKSAFPVKVTEVIEWNNNRDELLSVDDFLREELKIKNPVPESKTVKKFQDKKITTFDLKSTTENKIKELEKKIITLNNKLPKISSIFVSGRSAAQQKKKKIDAEIKEDQRVINKISSLKKYLENIDEKYRNILQKRLQAVLEHLDKVVEYMPKYKQEKYTKYKESLSFATDLSTDAYERMVRKTELDFAANWANPQFVKTVDRAKKFINNAKDQGLLRDSQKFIYGDETEYKNIEERKVSTVKDFLKEYVIAFANIDKPVKANQDLYLNKIEEYFYEKEALSLQNLQQIIGKVCGAVGVADNSKYILKYRMDEMSKSQTVFNSIANQNDFLYDNILFLLNHSYVLDSLKNEKLRDLFLFLLSYMEEKNDILNNNPTEIMRDININEDFNLLGSQDKSV